MTPYELVASRYGLPFTLYNYQVQTVNNLAPLPKSGHYLAVGVGKTATSTVSALFKKEQGDIDRVIVLMPPILLTSWYRWLMSIKGVSAMIYAGTPKQREKMKFDKDFTLMSYDIFKRDYDRIVTSFDHQRTCTIADEATAIKNVESKNYQKVRDFSEIGHLMLLTGTPLAKILDGYAYVKQLAPSIYRSFQQFKNIHVDEEDFFGTPIKFKNLDLLNRNMRVNSVRILKEDVLKELPDITYTPLHYDLDPKHLALYNQLAEEQLLEYEDGTKLDATEATRLWHALQQVVMNYDHFSQNPANISAGFDVIDQVMDELGAEMEGEAGKKLIIFTNYKLTSRHVTEHTKKYGSVAVYGEISAGQQQKNIDRFMTDPTCRVLVAQVQSAGYGLNLQDCCSDVLFMESPLIPTQFEQAVGRVYRNGQKRKVHIRVGIAQHTIQLRLLNILMKKDHLVNQVVRNYKDIRDALFGL
jgi:SNF2 family DNA or RNA helicase